MTAPARRLPVPATLEDLLALGEERFHELIDGELVQKATPTFEHGSAQLRIGRGLGPYDRRPGGPPDRPGGWWFATEVEVYFDEENTTRPDVVGWRRDKVPERPRGTPVRITPDWICEILSSNKRNDLIKKKRLYHRHQVGHYWIVDPVEETLLVYRWGPDGYIEVHAVQRGERVRAEPFKALDLPLAVFFGEDEEA